MGLRLAKVPAAILGQERALPARCLKVVDDSLEVADNVIDPVKRRSRGLRGAAALALLPGCLDRLVEGKLEGRLTGA